MPLDSEQRNCGTCTACCDGWLQIEIRGHKVGPGHKCPFSASTGCKIYDDRPQHPCREFTCGWLLHRSPLPEWMRPDKSALIVLPSKFLWRGSPVDVAVPAGVYPKMKALDWLKNFSGKHKRPLMYQIENEWYAFGPPAFQADISERLRNGERLWDFSSS
jgi:hypothetical protein